jgi:hypothetical protein
MKGITRKTRRDRRPSAQAILWNLDGTPLLCASSKKDVVWDKWGAEILVHGPKHPVQAADQANMQLIVDMITAQLQELFAASRHGPRVDNPDDIPISLSDVTSPIDYDHDYDYDSFNMLDEGEL